MCWRDRIERKPGVLTGKPVIKGTRLSVEFILDRLADDWSMDELLRNYSHICREDILACLHFASERLQAEHATRKRV